MSPDITTQQLMAQIAGLADLATDAKAKKPGALPALCQRAIRLSQAIDGKQFVVTVGPAHGLDDKR